MGLTQVEQGFSSFFAKFLSYLMIFQRSSEPSAARSTLKNHQIWQIIKISIVQLAFNPFLYGTELRVPETGFGVPVPPLTHTHITFCTIFPFLAHGVASTRVCHKIEVQLLTKAMVNGAVHSYVKK